MEIALLIWALGLTILLVVGVIWLLDLEGRLSQLRSRYERSFADGGEEDTSLAAALEDLGARFSKANARTERLAARTEQVDQALAHAVQGVGLVRFRAFEDTGGDQSFSVALTDGEGNGIVISALYGRDATRVYAKSVQDWTSPRSLTEEERQALTKARQAITPGG